MTPRDFCYWLQGFFEIMDANDPDSVKQTLTPDQILVIRKHLHLVFEHTIDPSFGDEKHVEALRKIHDENPEETAQGISEDTEQQLKEELEKRMHEIAREHTRPRRYGPLGPKIMC